MSPTPHAPQPKHILVVDDDTVQCTLIACSLDPALYAVTIASDKAHALSLCDTHYFDIAVLDYELPDGSGEEIANALRKSYDIPFLFLTMVDDSERARRPIKLGALNYLLKPISPRQLNITIENALEEIEHRSHLQKAVDVHGTIGLALGIIMNHAQISKEEGLKHLRGFCQPRNLSMRHVASHIVSAYEQLSQSRPREPFNLAKVLQELD